MQEPSQPLAVPTGGHHPLKDLISNRDFNLYTGARVCLPIIQSAQAAVMTWQAYELSGSALPIAILGLMRFVPGFAISLLAGAVVDTRDRRLVLALSQVAPLGTCLFLAIITAMGGVSLAALYVCALLLGVFAAFEGPARESLLPQLVPRESFQRAVALTTTISQLARVVGPATAGVTIAQVGVTPAYGFNVVVALACMAFVAVIRVRPESNPRGVVTLGLIKEGMVFVWTRPAILGAMTLDMLAVILAGAEALLPIYANEILGTGAWGYGLLASSRAIGSFAMSLALAVLPPIERTGRAMVITVALFGVFTIAFGLSTSFPLSLALYALTAACDQVSVLMRQNIIQLGTPDALRGRVNSVNQMFIGTSNQLGAFESGLLATIANSAVFAVVAGGVGCLLAVGVVAVLIPGLWRHRTGLGA
ncbi:MAG: transporter [Chloroflexi bacterium]|nr:transporter [Chloroflexota bacterium]